ncbi:MAG TPA: PadR family transcriptional regulator [Ureibacillus sp.]|nr:PadR family transcriptional regulator [Ureibacillus sp.]
MSVRSQLLKGILDGCVLAIIEKEEVYGYELSQKLQHYGLKDISEGTIYPVLLRLQKNKWIEGKMRPSDSGPNRKYYSLTIEGKENLRIIRDEWALLSTPITNILRGDEEWS